MTSPIPCLPLSSDWPDALALVAQRLDEGVALVDPAEQVVREANSGFIEWLAGREGGEINEFWRLAAEIAASDVHQWTLLPLPQIAGVWATARGSLVLVVVSANTATNHSSDTPIDALTGLADRRAFETRIAGLWPKGQPPQRPLAALFIDFDGFKQINDAFGHIAGDEALQTLAQRLQGVVRVGDFLARYGGDEFVVLVAGLDRQEDLDRLRQRLLTVADDPLELRGRQVRLGISIGGARSAEGFTSFTELLTTADQRMYAHKRRNA